MARLIGNHPRNRILAFLAPADRALLQGFLEPADLPLDEVLEVAGVPIKHVWFMESGFASVVAGRCNQIEVGLIGYEGMSGVSIVLGDDRSVNRTFMQASGTGLRMSVDNLRRAMDASATLRPALLRYAHAFLVQTTQTALVNGRSRLEARLARWLLMAHDRFDHRPLPFTHQFLSMKLGVRRAGVTVALHRLEGDGLIKAGRREITIVDRERLRAYADPSYGVAEAEYARLFDLPPQVPLHPSAAN